MITTAQDRNPAGLIDLIVRHQQSPETACLYLGDDPASIRADLDELDQPWLETARIALSEAGRLLGVVVIEWDEELDRSWVHGPWVEPEAWDDEAPALLEAVTAQAPVARHEMYADVRHERMARLAARCGWRPGEANAEYRLSLPAPDAAGADASGRRSSLVPLTPDADLQIGPATAEHAAALRELHDREFPGTYASAAQLLDPEGPYAVLVATRGGRMLGYVAVQERGETELYVDFLAVDPETRRQGVGAHLLEAARRALGRSTLTLTVDEHRPAARALYQRLGFELIASTRPYRTG